MEMLQHQLSEAREAERNLRRINTSLMTALESHNTHTPHTIKHLQNTWQEETTRRLKEVDSYWADKLQAEVRKRKALEKKFDN